MTQISPKPTAVVIAKTLLQFTAQTFLEKSVLNHWIGAVSLMWRRGIIKGTTTQWNVNSKAVDCSGLY